MQRYYEGGMANPVQTKDDRYLKALVFIDGIVEAFDVRVRLVFPAVAFLTSWRKGGAPSFNPFRSGMSICAKIAL